MLVLTRKYDQEVIITTPDGTKISVMVVALDDRQVRLGFQAPTTFRILRKELEDNPLPLPKT